MCVARPPGSPLSQQCPWPWAMEMEGGDSSWPGPQGLVHLTTAREASLGLLSQTKACMAPTGTACL